MTTGMLAGLCAAVLLLAVSRAGAGTITPNSPNPPPDPCGVNLCKQEPPKLCKTVRVHECVDYQGNPPHCIRYQDVTRQECS